jgi:hypothetical protein
MLEARRTPQHQPLQVVVIVGNHQHGDGFDIASDDKRAFNSAFVEIRAQTRHNMGSWRNPHGSRPSGWLVLDRLRRKRLLNLRHLGME